MATSLPLMERMPQCAALPGAAIPHYPEETPPPRPRTAPSVPEHSRTRLSRSSATPPTTPARTPPTPPTRGSGLSRPHSPLHHVLPPSVLSVRTPRQTPTLFPSIPSQARTSSPVRRRTSPRLRDVRH